MTRAELAQLLGKSVTTIDHWFSEKSSLEPPAEVCKRLDEINVRFLQWQLEDDQLSHLRNLYELVRDRQTD